MPVDTSAHVKVMYSCSECGVTKREVPVRAREEEDVVEWVEHVCMVAIRVDHTRFSPDCRAQTCDVMIPVSGADKIGGVTKQ